MYKRRLPGVPLRPRPETSDRHGYIYADPAGAPQVAGAGQCHLADPNSET